MGRVNYLTGGTTHIPRIIAYDRDRWDRSVCITADILRSHGIGISSRVAVIQPFAPWAIGNVFCEAAWQCGADVYPLGLYALEPPFTALLSEIAPTDFCCTAHNMLRLRERLPIHGLGVGGAGGLGRIFSAGEPIVDALRRQTEAAWRMTVVNVYGMSEFDTIAAECPGQHSLSLVSTFRYALRTPRGNFDLTCGAEGELLVRDGTGPWFPTGDLIRVVGPTASDSDIWKESWSFHILGRCEESITLSDGTAVCAWQLRLITDKYPEIALLQLRLTRETAGDRLLLCCVLHSTDRAPLTDGVRESLLASSIDIFDSYRQNIVHSVEVAFVEESELFRTPRGKIPLVVEE